MDCHLFSVRIAEKCGVNAALLLWYIHTLVDSVEEEHIHGGRRWVKASMDELAKEFPYMSKKAVRTAISKLLKGGYIVKGNYNENPFDRAAWYALGGVT